MKVKINQMLESKGDVSSAVGSAKAKWGKGWGELSPSQRAGAVALEYLGVQARLTSFKDRLSGDEAREFVEAASAIVKMSV